MEETVRFYKGLFKRNISVDVIGTETDFSKYKLIIAPLLYMNKNGFDEKLRNYIREGGNFITSFFSGYVDENDNVITGGYPGKWKDFMGFWVEESDAIPPEETNFFSYKGKTYEAGFICDLLRLEEAESLAEYGRDFYKGVSVLARNKYGEGNTWHVGTKANDDFYKDFLHNICDELGIKPISASAPEEVEVTLRENENGKYVFMLNHDSRKISFESDIAGIDLLSGNKITADEEMTIPAYGVVVIKQDR